MEAAVFSLIGAITGTLIGGLIAFLIQKQRFEQELKLKRKEFKKKFIAEDTVKHFLSQKSYTDRSFETT